MTESKLGLIEHNIGHGMWKKARRLITLESPPSADACTTHYNLSTSGARDSTASPGLLYASKRLCARVLQHSLQASDFRNILYVTLNRLEVSQQTLQHPLQLVI